MILTIISYTQLLDKYFEEIAFKVLHPRKKPKSTFSRFQNDPENFRLALRNPYNTTIDGRTKIKYLDLVGHGSSKNEFRIGDEKIIENNKIKEEYAKHLKFYLLPGTIIRLLGCRTGNKTPGLEMLKAVSASLGGRTILGTTTIIKADDFNIDGLRKNYTHFNSSSDEQSNKSERFSI